MVYFALKYLHLIGAAERDQQTRIPEQDTVGELP